MIFETPPADFNPNSHVVGVLLEFKGKILLLKRNTDKNCWAQPAGKIEPEESREDAIVRETAEETGIMLNKDRLCFLKSFFVRYPAKDFTFAVFRYDLSRKPELKLSAEHTDAVWIEPREALSLDLIPDEDYCLKTIYNL